VRFEELASRVNTTELRGGSSVELGPVRVRAEKLNHPGGVLGYRIEYAGKVLVYATDTEHYRCADPALVRLAQDADILIYDAQYTPEEYRGDAGPSKAGWGHSTFESGVEVCQAARVKQLILFHHDPRRNDAGVEALEQRARALFPNTLAAREGMELSLLENATRAA
jgi:ribonuclease BN (tRNA processing enzyme)